MPDELNALQPKTEAICCNLRSKAMYVYGSMEVQDDGAEEDAADMDDGYFWCLRTMSCLGPDKEDIGRQQCRPGRSCYQAL